MSDDIVRLKEALADRYTIEREVCARSTLIYRFSLNVP